MKNAKVVSSVASNKPDGLSIALIVILVLIIIACILWYMYYKPTNIFSQPITEGFDDDNNQIFFQKKNKIENEFLTDPRTDPDPVHAPLDVLERSLMTGEQINDHFRSTKKKRQ